MEDPVELRGVDRTHGHLGALWGKVGAALVLCLGPTADAKPNPSPTPNPSAATGEPFGPQGGVTAAAFPHPVGDLVEAWRALEAQPPPPPHTHRERERETWQP